MSQPNTPPRHSRPSSGGRVIAFNLARATSNSSNSSSRSSSPSLSTRTLDEPTEDDVASLDTPCMTPNYCVQTVLMPAIAANAVKPDINQFPFSPCRLSKLDLEQAVAKYQEVSTRDRDDSVEYEMAPLLSSINYVRRQSERLRRAGLVLPVQHVYVGARKIGYVNTDHGGVVMHAHQAILQSHTVSPPWWRAEYIINARAHTGMSQENIECLSRAMMATPTRTTVDRGNFTFTKISEIPNTGGAYVIGHTFDAAVLQRCIDTIYTAEQMRVVEQVYGVATRAAIEMAKLHRMAIVTNAAAFEILFAIDAVPGVKGTFHDAPPGTIPACAHVVTSS